MSISSRSEDGEIGFFETLVTINQTTLRHTPEEDYFHSRRCAILQFCVSLLLIGSCSQEEGKITEVLNSKVIQLPLAIPDANNFTCILINFLICFTIRLNVIALKHCLQLSPLSHNLFSCLYIRDNSDSANMTVLRQ